MINYAPNQAHDKGGNVINSANVPRKALARYTNENATASSVISVSHDTTALEVTAVGLSAVVRWVPTTETAAVSPFASVITVAGATSNYDGVVPANTTRYFVIPIESQGTGNSSIVGANRQNGLYQRVAIKSTGIASVMVAEFN
jgi:hypothetical protein